MHQFNGSRLLVLGDNAEPSDRPTIYSLENLLDDNTLPPPAIVGDGVLLEKTILLIYGPPKSRKTFLACNFGLSILSGFPFAGFKVPHPRSVLFLSAEGGYFPSRDRIKTMCKRFKQAPAEGFDAVFDVRDRLNLVKKFDALQDLIAERNPQVLIIDPLVRFHDADENSSTGMAEVFNNLRTLVEEFHLSIILVHHTGKDERKGARGSSAIMGEYDSAIQISKDSEMALRHTLSFDMRHVETPGDREIVFNSKTLWFEQASCDDVGEYLRRVGAPMSRKDLVRGLVQEDICAKSTAYKAISRALKNGAIVCQSKKYSCGFS